MTQTHNDLILGMMLISYMSTSNPVQQHIYDNAILILDSICNNSRNTQDPRHTHTIKCTHEGDCLPVRYSSDNVSPNWRDISRRPCLTLTYILENKDKLVWKHIVKNIILDDNLISEAVIRLPRYYITYNCVEIYQKIIKGERLGTRDEIRSYFKSIRNMACIREYTKHICGKGFATIDYMINILDSRGYVSHIPEDTQEQPEKRCVICLDDVHCITEDLPCGHVFHRECIHKWECESYSCPVCRCDLARDSPLSKCAQAVRINNKKKSDNIINTLTTIGSIIITSSIEEDV